MRKREPDDSVTFDLADVSDGVRSLMSSRGVSRHLMKGRVTLDESWILPCLHPAFRPISPKTQLGQLRRCIEAPTSGSYLLVIGSMHDENVAEAVAIGLMQAAMSKTLLRPSETPRPFLHPVYGGWKDRLRDDDKYREVVGRIGLLVINNLADNSTPAKLEAARDLLHMYSSIPRVLVVSGADPWAFSIDVLRRKPSRVLHVGRSARSVTVTRQI